MYIYTLVLPFCIRVTVCEDLTDEELEEAARVITAVAAKHISKQDQDTANNGVKL